MKRLFTLIAISILLFNWIGYQMYACFADRHINSDMNPAKGQKDFQQSTMAAGKTTAFHISFYAKEIDFDDLLEFTSTPDYSVNEIFFDISNDLFLNHENKEDRFGSFKCFNGEYYSRQDKIFIKYPDTTDRGKIPDRYLLKIPIVFLSSKDHPPQHLS